MLCPEGERLRDEWYSTATILAWEMDEKRRNILEANRRMPEYMIAKEAYIKHLCECDDCKRGRVK